MAKKWDDLLGTIFFHVQINMTTIFDPLFWFVVAKLMELLFFLSFRPA